MSDGEKMMEQRERGDKLADTCLSLYALHVKAPEDPGARGLFQAAYKEWRQRESTGY